MLDDMPTFIYYITLYNYMHVFTLVPKHLLLHTATKCFGPTWYTSACVLNSSYDLDFVDSFSSLVTASIRGCSGL